MCVFSRAAHCFGGREKASDPGAATCVLGGVFQQVSVFVGLVYQTGANSHVETTRYLHEIYTSLGYRIEAVIRPAQRFDGTDSRPCEVFPVRTSLFPVREGNGVNIPCYYIRSIFKLVWLSW